MLASLFNLAGPDLIIILLILLMLGGPFLLAYLLGGFSDRRSAPRPPVHPPPLPTTEARLEKLESLRRQGHISEVEYEEQRRRILGGI